MTPPRSRTRPRALGITLLAVAGLAAACTTPGSVAGSTTTTGPVGTIATTSTLYSGPPTTTLVIPATPLSDASAAAATLVHDWMIGDRVSAAKVATAGAVATLFAAAYAGQTVVSRQCSITFTPAVCSYGPNGGGSGKLYQIYVSPVGSLWYVSSVTIEG